MKFYIFTFSILSQRRCKKISKITEVEAKRLQRRLRTKLDYYVATLLWGFFIFSFLSVWFLGIIDPINAGFQICLQVAPILVFFPIFATFGMISDRILASDSLKLSKISQTLISKENKQDWKVIKEDYVRIIAIIVLVVVALPWIAARLGHSQTLFFNPVHLGEHHGYIGFYMLISLILISKTEKLYTESIFKEISIYLLCFLTIWGSGLFLEDFLKEQLYLNFPFIVFFDFNQLGVLVIQILVVGGLSYIIYYLGWRNYYREKLKHGVVKNQFKEGNSV